MRKVLLEQNLGKKTKCRFPRRNQKLTVIKLTIESQRAVSTPSLTQPLVISGVSVIEFCEKFNQLTINLEPGLKLRSKAIVYLATKTFDLELMVPSVYQLLLRVFQQSNLNNIIKKNNILMQILHNTSLIKLTQLPGFYKSDLVNNIKQICGNLRSYQLRFTAK